MGQILRRSLLGLALVCGLVLSNPALAEVDRESTGRIVSVDDGALVIDQRGDQMSFQRTPDTAVRGAKDAWSALAPDDRVTVHWDLSDQPKRAHRVEVMPARR